MRLWHVEASKSTLDRALTRCGVTLGWPHQDQDWDWDWDCCGVMSGGGGTRHGDVAVQADLGAPLLADR
jgi:hypothetical protein